MAKQAAKDGEAKAKGENGTVGAKEKEKGPGKEFADWI